ncbi:MAG: bifunctional oligoribonuclease/PAP phosphatase NrnA [Anaerolineales bacterium]|nr:bifunctional oligoribonuclease/PAP phosphatase NrnA [Anaerolineales bacterium]HUS83863.1 bifunctional oligoribonuclease/PAP phosphatase NrnA [Anaerolineales bacterium]
MGETTIEMARAAINAAQRVIILSHERPDGDAVGSLLALTLSLERVGKNVTPVLLEGVPSRFRFLPGADKVKTDIPSDGDLLILVDASDLQRTGFPIKTLPRQPDINIDHHPTNTDFALINIVNHQASATTEILYDIIPQLGLEIDTEVATNLMTGLITDTIGFRTDSVTSRTLEIASELVGIGAPMAEIYARTLNQRSFVSAQYWGRGLNRLERENGILWTSLTVEDRELVGYPGSDDADLVNLLATIEGIQVVLIFIEQVGGKVKVSWRSRPGVNVAEIAFSFGGGGHEQAAGATIEGGMQEIKERVLTATRGSISLSPEEFA